MFPQNHQLNQCSAWPSVSYVLKLFRASVAFAIVVWAGQNSFATNSSLPVAQTVQAHIEAGEFGPAIDQALAVKDPGQQVVLLKQIAETQAQAGDSAAARATLRRISNRQERSRAIWQQQFALAGGGVIANPGPLMNLITQNTNGEWEDEGGVGGRMSWFPTGVMVSPNGLLERITTKEQSRTLAALGIEARKADLSSDLARSSSLRLVSLTRMNQELSDHLAQGRPIPASMALLAGLTKVKYVFVFPDSDEVVIGGPAESWEYNTEGLAIGTESHLPTLQLDDFVTVLRMLAKGETDFGCSINTRDANTKSLQKFVEGSLARGPLNAGAGVANFVKQVQKNLGYQDIVVWGVPADSHVARVLVEADYRMKLIGIGKLDGGKEVPSYFDLIPQDLQRNPAPMEALRWWLTMNYDAVLHSADRNVFEIQGGSVLCQSENQFLTSEGQHLPTGKSEGINREFAENFTHHYAALAQKNSIFADARNVFDLALVSALICKEGLVDPAGTNLSVFALGGLYQPATYAVPKEVESVVNHRVYHGRDVVVQAAGGVRANIDDVLAKDNVKHSPQLDRLAKAIKLPELPAGRWWWDVAR